MFVNYKKKKKQDTFNNNSIVTDVLKFGARKEIN